jgi:nucleoside-diphosphate-sugar epimerase
MPSTTLSYEPRLPLGSTILITGVNGLIASHTADQALLAGYRVRGTVRSASKAAWMKDLFESRYGADKFEVVEVPDIEKEGAFDEAIKGVAGVAHIASVLGDYNPEVAIGGSIQTNLTLLKSAAKESSVKAVAITSSSMSQGMPTANKKVTIGQDTWNDFAEEHAYDKPYKQENLWLVYAASKVFGEKEAWKWVKENKPAFAFNTGKPLMHLWVISANERISTAISKLWRNSEPERPGYS